MTHPNELVRGGGSPIARATPEPLALDRQPAAVYLAQLAPGSRRTMRAALNTIAGLLGVAELRDDAGRDMRALAVPWHTLDYQHTSALRAALAERFAPATSNKHIAALRRTLKEAWRLGLMSAEAYERAADVRQITAERLPRGRALSGGEIAALLAACTADPTMAGVRDAALIAMLRGVGLRRAEAVALDLADYNPEDADAITIRAGKGNKDRVVYLPEGAALFLADWLAYRGTQPGPLFYPIAKGGKMQRRRLTDQSVFFILKKRRMAAGVAAFSPHDMRRSLISGLLDSGADLATVQKLAGHEDPATTSRYDRRGEAAKKKARELVHIPHSPRKP